MKLLCAIGVHAWREVGFTLPFGFGVNQCARCGCGREFCGYYTVTYTKEQMADAVIAALEGGRDGR